MQPPDLAKPEDVADVLHGLVATLRFQMDVCPHPWAKKDMKKAWEAMQAAEAKLRTEHHS